MNCLRCGFKNPATVAYCQKCGGKLDLTADEIAEALVQKAQDERAKSTEFYARQSLFFGVIIFMMALTLVFLSGGAETRSYAVPSIVGGTNYTSRNYSIREQLHLPKGLIKFSR